MRKSIKRLSPTIYESRTGRLYVHLDLGKLSRVENGGYKLEGPIFATAETRARMHVVLDELMERLDKALAKHRPASPDYVSRFIQDALRRRRLDEVTAVEAASWLDANGVLNDSASRPGLPLRNLLRARRIHGAEQRPATSYGRWFIARSR